MIIRTSFATPVPGHRWGMRGLGQMPQLTSAQYAALTPWQQQAFGNGDPNFMSATGPMTTGPAYQPDVQPVSGYVYVPPASTLAPAPAPAPAVPAPSYPQASSTAQQVLASLQPAVQTPTLTTIPFGSSTTTTYTLDSRMAQWAAGAIAMPSSLAGADPMSEAAAVAQSYCAQQAVPDCSNILAIASKYGTQVAQALASEPALVQAVSQPNTTGQPISVTPQPSSVSVSQSAAASSSGPVVVNPSPPSQPVTTGASISSPGSAVSQANGTSLTTTDTTSTQLIPGIDNSVLFIGAGALALVLMLAMKGK